MGQELQGVSRLRAMWVDARSTHARRLKRSTRPYKNISSFDQAFSMVYTEEEGPRPFDPNFSHRDAFPPTFTPAGIERCWKMLPLPLFAADFPPFFLLFPSFDLRIK